MKEVYWGYWLILLGVFITIVMMMISNVTTSSTQDYYLIKEVTEAAMLDSVDLAIYRDSGNLKINQEKFVESFLRRFSENISITKTYNIEFYDIMEEPPKVSVKVSSNSSTFTIAGDSRSFDIVSKVDAILELPRTNTNTNTNTASVNVKLEEGVFKVQYTIVGKKEGVISNSTGTINCNKGDTITFKIFPKDGYSVNNNNIQHYVNVESTDLTFGANK